MTQTVPVQLDIPFYIVIEDKKSSQSILSLGFKSHEWVRRGSEGYNCIERCYEGEGPPDVWGPDAGDNN